MSGFAAAGARPRLIVITGERGAGKSVVCARLAALLVVCRPGTVLLG